MSQRHTTARYTMSKLAELHYARASSEQETDVEIVAIHPGMVATNLHHASTGFILKPISQHSHLICNATGEGSVVAELGSCECRCQEWAVLLPSW